MRKVYILFLLAIMSCAEPSGSRGRIVSSLTPGEQGGACPSQVQADIELMENICNVQGYSWQKHDILLNCLEEINSIKLSYPKLNCSIAGREKKAEDIDARYRQTMAFIYTYKTGDCGTEPLLNYNELFEDIDPTNPDSLKRLTNDLDDFADRYRGINCEVRESEIRYSNSPQKIKLTRELINQIMKRIENGTFDF